jgi:TRAP-type C4-dicarboxylate transport system permease small subunit
VFWSLASLLDEREQVAFGLLYDQAAPPVRRVLAITSAALIAALFLAALPGTYDFVSFTAIDQTWVLHLRFDLVFWVFLLFMVAVIVRSPPWLRRLLGRDWRDAL